MEPEPQLQDARFIALIDVLRRSGASEVQIRYSDDEKPIIWMAVVGWRMYGGRPRSTGIINRFETAAGLDPLSAAYRLAETIIDGGQCQHCGRPTGVSDDWVNKMPLDTHICWYIYDPENETFRRSCEGDT